MKISKLAFLSVALVLMGAGCSYSIGDISSNDEPAPQASPSTEKLGAIYSDSELGFSIKPPVDWSIVTDDQNAPVIFKSQTATSVSENYDFRPNIQINNGTVAKDLADDATEYQSNSIDGAESYTFTDGVRGSVDGHDTYSFNSSYTSKDLGTIREIVEIVRAEDGYGYVLSATAADSDWSAMEPLFKASIATFKP